MEPTTRIDSAEFTWMVSLLTSMETLFDRFGTELFDQPSLIGKVGQRLLELQKEEINSTIFGPTLAPIPTGTPSFCALPSPASFRKPSLTLHVNPCPPANTTRSLSAR